MSYRYGSHINIYMRTRDNSAALVDQRVVVRL